MLQCSTHYLPNSSSWWDVSLMMCHKKISIVSVVYLQQINVNTTKNCYLTCKLEVKTRFMHRLYNQGAFYSIESAVNYLWCRDKYSFFYSWDWTSSPKYIDYFKNPCYFILWNHRAVLNFVSAIAIIPSIWC